MQDEAYLAELILKDLKAKEEFVKTEGVCAYLRHPQKRKVKSTLNRNFLQKTLHNVAYRNQKTEEELLWKAREKQLKTPPKRKSHDDCNKRKRPRSRKSKLNDDRNPPHEVDEVELERFLQSKKKRGRGGIGSCHDFVGPKPLMEDPNTTTTRVYGPQRPNCLKRSSRH
eukprot:g3815.t1